MISTKPLPTGGGNQLCRLAAFCILALNSLAATAFGAGSEATKQSMSLDGLLKQALKTNFSLQSQAITIRENESGSRQTFGLYLPRVDLNFNRANTRQDPATAPGSLQESTRNTLSLQVSQSIDLRGDNWRKYQSSLLQTEASRLKLEVQQSEVAYQIIEKYYELVSSSARIRARDSQIKQLQAVKNLVAEQIKLGKQAELELSQPEYELAEAQIKRSELTATLARQQQEILLLAFGEQTHPQIKIQTAQDYDPFFVKGWKSVLAEPQLNPEQLPEMQSLNLEHEAAEILRLGKTRYLPTLDLIFENSRDYSNRANGNSDSDPATKNSITLAANWNLFASGADFYEIRKEAYLNQKESLALKEKTQRQRLETRSIKTQLMADAELIPARTKLLQAAKNNLESHQARYGAGQISTRELLDVQLQFTEAEIELKVLQGNFYTRLAQFLHTQNKLISRLRNL